MIKKGLVVLFFILMISVAYAAFSPTYPWHPIQQISGDYGTTSVDDNQDGIIDNSAACNGDAMCEASSINATGYLILGNGAIAFNDTSRTYFYHNGSEWKQFGIGDSWLAPSGTVSAFYAESCPLGWTLADGSAGTPDLRGVSIRGLDLGRGLDSGRTLGSYQADALLTHLHSINDPGHTHTLLSRTEGTAGGGQTPKYGGTGAIINNEAIQSGTTGITVQNAGTASETRVKNVALIYCIKTAEDVDTSNLIWGQNSDYIFALNNTKNVGIGTNTPGEKLVVQGKINSSTDVCITGGKCLSQTTTVGGFSCTTYTSTTNTATCLTGIVTGGGVACTTGPYSVMASYPSGNGWYGTCAAGALTVYATCCTIS